MPVTNEVIQSNILTIQYHAFVGTTVTVCCITLKNGFTVLGEAACVDHDDFDKELGESIALEDAINNVWKFLGFRMKERQQEAELA